MTKHWFEDVKMRCGERVLMSNVRPATSEEVESAAELHAVGKCPHTIIEDTEGYMYDLRYCVTCGAFLGFI